MKDTSEKQCFVIMPFGEKQDVGGKIIDFNKIYDYLIKPALEKIEEYNVKCIRCDEISRAGWIHADMMEHIRDDEIAIADLTTLNPNVFYELGVRHALRKSGTVLIHHKGTKNPFNISGFRIIDYDHEDLKSVEEAKNQIAEFVVNGLKLRDTDSLVHQVLGERISLQETSHPIKKCQVTEFSLRNASNKKICIITGDINGVKKADIWVNSENTNMQMARYYDKSISSIIRYLGARRNEVTNEVEDDTIFKELTEKMGKLNAVPPATVFVTNSGALEKTHNVRKIFHVATVVGMIGRGYTPIANIGECITAALSKADSDSIKKAGLKTILFPTFGTGTGGGKPENIIPELIGSAISYLESNPDSIIEKVYFLAYSKEELDVYCSTLSQSKDILHGDNVAAS